MSGRSDIERLRAALERVVREDLYSVGVFVDGEPHIWDGYATKEPPTPEQAERMRKAYAESVEF
jgi:hypothetical protein